MALFRERAASGDAAMALSPSSKAAIHRIVRSALTQQTALTNGASSTAPHSAPSLAHAATTNDPAVTAFLRSAAHEHYVHRQFKRLTRHQQEREWDGGHDPRWSMEIGRSRPDVNRYTDVIPYNASRVVVKSGLSARGTNPDDYINASYVYSPRNARRYIATQGPTQSTMKQFWRMVWENVSTTRADTVSTIIMLTRVREGGAEKCAHYWPRQGQVLEIPYRDGSEIKTLNVRLKEQEAVSESDCTVTTVILSSQPSPDDTNNPPQYEVKHLLYNGWRDMSVPDSAETFLNYFQLFHRYHTSSASPIVHCTAGVGRTGVFIALDYLFSTALEMSPEEIASDPVFETVDELRSCRTLMVCREPQLEYVYTLFREMILAEQNLTTNENGN
jgi:protein-tyrosine phosphatase